MELVYRQALLWTGVIYAPMIGWIGIVSNCILYFVKYISLRYFYRPPLKPYSAATIHTFFLQLLLASLLFPIGCFCIFVMAEASPKCGPLRDPTCVVFSPAPATTEVYNLSCDDTRSNYQEFNAFFIPSTVTDLDVSGTALDTVSGDEDGSDLVACDARCWLKTALTSIVSVPMLLCICTLLLIATRFARASARRLQKEVTQLQAQLAEEHHDKVRLMRVAGITLD